MDNPSTPSSNSGSDGVVSAVTGQLWYNSLVAIAMLVISAIALVLRFLSLLRGEWARRQEIDVVRQQETEAAKEVALQAIAAMQAEEPEVVTPEPARANGFRQRLRMPTWRKQKAASVAEVVEVEEEVSSDVAEAAVPPATRGFRPRLPLPAWSFRKQKSVPVTEGVEVEEVLSGSEGAAAPTTASRGFRPRLRLPSWSFRKQTPAAAIEMEEAGIEAEESAPPVAAQGFRHRVSQALEQGRGRLRRGGTATS